jgi:CRISPR-associated Csx11 family protein
MTGDFEILDKNKDALRLVQAGALLHNLGKCTSQFFDETINKKNGSAPDFRYQHILHLIEIDYPLLAQNIKELYDDLQKNENKNVLDSKTVDYLKRSFDMPFPFDDRSYRPGDMIEYLGQGDLDNNKKLYEKPGNRHWIGNIFKNGSRLTHLMNRAHRGASGGEKQDIYVKEQKNSNEIYKSTPFGWESQSFNLTDVDNFKTAIEAIIQAYLDINNKTIDFDDFCQKIRPNLEAVIADTQRPLNDVTVWDIGHTGMAFLMAQALGMVVQEHPIPHHFLLAEINEKNTLFWRVLKIRINGIDYLERAPSLAEMRVRLRCLKETSENIRQILEGLPVAIRVYSDENGSFYIFPDLPVNNSFVQTVMRELKSQLTVDGVAFDCSLSEPLVNHPDDKGQYIGEYISRHINEEIPIVYDRKFFIDTWENKEGHEICIACGIRPQGYDALPIPDYSNKSDDYIKKEKNRHLCCICMDRRRDVAKRWATHGLRYPTIWIDEIADTNGRVALLVGKIDIEQWDMWYPKSNENSSEKLQPIKRFLKIVNLGKSLKNQDVVSIRKHDFKWDEQKRSLVRDIDMIETNIPKFVQDIQVQNIGKIEIDNIQLEGSGYRLELKQPHKLNIGENLQVMGIQFSVADELTIITEENAKVERFFLHDNRFIILSCNDVYATTESQSFARLRRVWETTKHFWEEVGDFSKLRKAEKRLQITGKRNPNAPNWTLGHYHVYQLLLGNVKLSAVWDPEKHRFISASNLDYLAKSDRLGKNVKDWLEEHKRQEIKIEEPTGYGSKNKEWGTITIEKVEPIPDSEYISAIPILAEPRTFMALVPADKAIDIVTDIKNNYELEMGKVRNRLPIHLGIAFADYKTPLRVILDAGRRMLKQESFHVEGWHVIKKESPSSDIPLPPDYLKNNKHFAECVRLELSRDERRAVWHVPLKMGDGSTDDEWYPYVFVQYDKDGETPSGRTRMFEAPCPWNTDVQGKAQSAWLVHASDIHEGDVIYFTPSTLDFQWLDTGGRRFEIAYDDKGCRQDMQRRPYMLDELVTFKKIWDTLSAHLTSSQIHALNELIETKRNDWKDSSETSGVFTQFCRDTIANIDWRKKEMENERVYPWGNDTKTPEKAWLDEWTGYATRGLLTDVIELYMKILKKKPECEEKS